MKLLAHVLPIKRCLFDLHAIKEFSVGVAMENYRWFKIFIPSTGRVRIADTIRWFPHGNLKIPTPSKDEIILSAIDDLRAKLQLSAKNNIVPPEGTTSRETCLTLIPYSRIETYLILIPNPQYLPMLQGCMYNQRIPLEFQGWNFIKSIQLEFQGCNHQPLHLHHNQHFDYQTVFTTSPIL